MIIENEIEQKVFDFVMNLASEGCGNICDDLNPDELIKFKDIKVTRYDDDLDTGEMKDGKIQNGEFEDPVYRQGDLIVWLTEQIK